MKIKEIPYQQIDFQKYDDCIAHSQYPIIYAESWYLDIVTQKNWSVLVYGDYDAVMPIPYARLKRNLFLKTVCQPMFCQQLGYFEKKKLEGVQTQMLKKIKQKRITSYHLNSTNVPSSENIKSRKNYIIDLKDGFELNRHHKRNIQKAKNKGVEIIFNHENIEDFLSFFLMHNPMQISHNQKKMIREIIKESIHRNCGKIVVAQSKEQEKLAMLFVLKKYDRLIYLLPAVSEKGKKVGATHSLIHYLLNQTDYQYFDFEGSEIEGIEKFFKGFGATKNLYGVL